ncbi:MAG TPA: type II secretion system F family protein [Phycisphaerales bacterium]|nr:type II secretion system F family protein [Phycisphaerales bacterium]
MPIYSYTAVSSDGKQSNGTFKAVNRERLMEHLRNLGLTPVSIQEQPEGSVSEPSQTTKKVDGDSGISFSMGISRKDLMVFTRQLATTLNAGLPLIRIIHVVCSESNNPKVKKVMGAVGTSLQKGKSFSQALEEHPKIFDAMYVNMVKVGERSGDLPSCVGRLAELIEKEMSLRRKVKSAMAYPSFILLFTTVMTYALVAFMMPLFIPVFRDSGLDIERDYPLTHFLLEASDFATSGVHMGGLLTFVVLLLGGFKLVIDQPAGRLAWDALKVNFPFIKSFFRNVIAARFSRSFSLLLKSGVPLVDAMSLVARAAGNESVAKKLNKGARNIGEGEGITKTLKGTNIFPDMLIQMSAMGEEAGSLPDMMERVADYYDEEVDASVDALTALLEPSMMILIGGVVCVFVMGVLLPILGVSSSVQEQM